MKDLLSRLATGMLILVGINIMILYIHNDWNWWIGTLGNVMVIAGLDLRYWRIRMTIKKYAIKVLTDDPTHNNPPQPTKGDS